MHDVFLGVSTDCDWVTRTRLLRDFVCGLIFSPPSKILLYFGRHMLTIFVWILCFYILNSRTNLLGDHEIDMFIVFKL